MNELENTCDVCHDSNWSDAEGARFRPSVLQLLCPANDFTPIELLAFEQAKNSSDVIAAQKDLIFISRLHGHIGNCDTVNAIVERAKEMFGA